MTCLRFKKSVNEWFESTLPSKNLFEFVDNILSEVRILNCGVPPGSFLRLFLLYINDTY